MGLGIHAGSRNVNGNVPNANWNDNQKFYVNWYNVNNSNDNIRARQAVSPQGLFESLRVYWVRYLIQPLVILEISCSSVSNRVYFLRSIALIE